jgi:RNA polymerase sigma factor (sigma-70 family)
MYLCQFCSKAPGASGKLCMWGANNRRLVCERLSFIAITSTIAALGGILQRIQYFLIERRSLADYGSSAIRRCRKPVGVCAPTAIPVKLSGTQAPASSALPRQTAAAQSRRLEHFLETRASLVGRLKDWRDDRSWREFVNTYGGLLYSVALQAGLTEQEAQEALQETLVSVAKTMPSFKYDPSVCSFKTWLRHLAHKRIADQFRKRAPAGAPLAPAIPDATSQTEPLERIPDPRSLDPELAWNVEWQKYLFAAAVKRVKARVGVEQFQIFDLYVLKGWPVKRVASTLGVSSAQVYLTKHRVMGMIKQDVKRLEREGL